MAECDETATMDTGDAALRLGRRAGGELLF